MLRAVQMVVETAKQPAHQVTRPAAAGVVIRPDERTPLVAQGQHLLPHDLLADVARRPLPQATEPLRERSGVRRMISPPDALPQGVEPLLEVHGPLPDLQERMEEAEDQR